MSFRPMADFGSHLSALLERMQVSNQELARRMDVDGSSLRRLRRNAHQPNYATIEKIAQALGIPTSQVIPPDEPDEGASGLQLDEIVPDPPAKRRGNASP